jgi:hypothetical protein
MKYLILVMPFTLSFVIACNDALNNWITDMAAAWAGTDQEKKLRRI